MKYRSDIDGLRAVAVIAVVLYHAEVPSFRGGYVGVDVFFVISGFLITSIVAQEIEGSGFSLIHFYERRIRRIFPAFFVLLSCVMILGYVLFLPEQMRELGREVVAATLFVSNVLFWRDTGYFAAPAETRPLLHTWSLGVEEQFYVTFPLILVILFRWTGRRLSSAIIGATAIGSLALSLIVINRHPDADFYFIGTRAWELLLGASLVLLPVPVIKSDLLQNVLSVVGLLLIAWAIFIFSNTTPFPGANALIPCLGAGLIIYAGMGSESLAGRVLSLPPLVFIGLISYSLYLWHWPLIVFAQYYSIRPLSVSETAIVLAGSVLMATISWQWVEKPFRKSPAWSSRAQANSVGNRGLCVSAFVAVSISAAIGYGLVRDDGFPSRLASDVRALANGSEDVGNYRDRCLVGLTEAALSSGQLCKLGASGKNPSFLLWGDSHAAALADGLDLEATKNDQAGVFVGIYSCPPLLGVFGWWDQTSQTCQTTNATIPSVIKQFNIQTVILHASWSRLEPGYAHELFASGNFGNDENRVFDLAFGRTVETLRRLHVTNIYVVTSIPGANYDVPTALARAKLSGRHIEIGIAPDEFRTREKFVTELFGHYRDEKDITFIHPSSVLCGREACDVERTGQPLYYDNAHLSKFGSDTIAPILQPIFNGFPASEASK